VKTNTPYGPLHQTISIDAEEIGAAPIAVEIQHPFAIFWYVCNVSIAFTEMLKRTAAACPCSPAAPWRILLYSDGVDPGNQLAYRHSRKMDAVYWSILEFGSSVLSDEMAWFELATIRQTTSENVKARLSGVITALGLTFFDENGHDMRHGMALQLADGSSMMIFLTFGMNIADECALHETYCCKGSGGLKPCMLDQNVFNAQNKRGIVESATSWCVLHTCSAWNRIRLHTTDSITGILRRLQRDKPNILVGDFDELQTRLGWNLVPGSLMMHPQMSRLMDPVSSVCYDWMHIFYVSGIFNVHVGCMMQGLKPHRITYSVLDVYLKKWRWPMQIGPRSGQDACSEKRAKASWDDGTFKAQASEGRSVLIVLAHFVSRIVVPSAFDTVRAHGACFMLLVELLILIEKVGRGTTTPDALQHATSTYLAAYRNLYADENMTIKFHYCMHLPDFLRRWGFLPNCFALERKHRVPKRFANQVTNTECNWDACVLRELTNYRVHHLTGFGSSHFRIHAELVDPLKPRPALLQQLQAEWGNFLEFKVSRCARVHQYEKVSKGDVFITNDGVVGQVITHFSMEVGELQILTNFYKWEVFERSARFCKARRKVGVDDVDVCFTDTIVCALVVAGDDIATCLYPFRVL
jgi:hypothetical protein